MSGRTIGEQVGRITLHGENEDDAVCPRCGYRQRHFDLLAIQPNFIEREKLSPVFKCPECKHLFALADDGV